MIGIMWYIKLHQIKTQHNGERNLWQQYVVRVQKFTVTGHKRVLAVRGMLSFHTAVDHHLLHRNSSGRKSLPALF